MAEKNKRKKDPEIFVPAGLFIGISIDFLTEQFSLRLFIGLEAGFVAMTRTKVVKKR